MLEKAMQEAPEKREAQTALAEELTEIVHGKEGLAKAKRITETFFHGDIMSLAPEEIKEGLADALKCHVEDGMGLLDAMILGRGIFFKRRCKAVGAARIYFNQWQQDNCG